MKLEAVIKKTVCRAEGYFDVNPTFFESKGCYGCSFFHVCRIAMERQVNVRKELNDTLNGLVKSE